MLFFLQSDPVELIEDLQEKYDENNAIRIEFTQIVSDGFDYTTEIQGDFSFKQPNFYKYTTEEGQIMTDMALVWDYRPELKQVRISDYSPNSQQVKPSDFFLSYRSNYNAVFLRIENKLEVIKLFPKGGLTEGSNFNATEESILVWVDVDQLEIKKVEMTKKNGNIVTYKITKTDFKPTLTKNDFTFKAIQGVEEVDMRF
jgi:outer membrane lipoprotein-sorting protein